MKLWVVKLHFGTVPEPPGDDMLREETEQLAAKKTQGEFQVYPATARACRNC